MFLKRNNRLEIIGLANRVADLRLKARRLRAFAFRIGSPSISEPEDRFNVGYITNQILVWAVINGLVTLALVPFAPKRARRSGIIEPSILIALATVVSGYAALWVADLGFKIDFRF